MTLQRTALLLAALIVKLLATAAFAGIRAPGKYSGVVVFDRWDTCYLYSGVCLMPVSEKVKESLRQYAGQAITINALDVYQPMNPGDALIRKLEVLGPAPENVGEDPLPRVPKLAGLRLTALPSFDSDGEIELQVEIRNESPQAVWVEPKHLAPTLFAKGMGALDPSDGPSYALVTRCSATSLASIYCGKRFSINSKVTEARLSLKAGSELLVRFQLKPSETRILTLGFKLTPGEYDFIAGYGGGVHEGRALVSNHLAFDVDTQGKPHFVSFGSGVSTHAEIPRPRATGAICGKIQGGAAESPHNARVLLWPLETGPQPRPVKWTAAEEDGTYRLAVVSTGTYRLSATAAGPDVVHSGFYGGSGWAQAMPVPVNPGDSACKYDFVLFKQPGHTIRGQGRPWEGSQMPPGKVLMSLLMVEGDAYPFEQHVLMQPTGEFEFREVPPGRYALSVELAYIGSGMTNSTEVEVREDRNDLVVDVPSFGSGTTRTEFAGGQWRQIRLSEVEEGEYSAESALKRLIAAQKHYSETYNKGFSEGLNCLGPPPLWDIPSAENAGLLEPLLSGRFPGDTNTSFTADGYAFTYTPGQKNNMGQITTYTLAARPLQYGKTGQSSFFTDHTGVIRATIENRPAIPQDSPIE